MRYRQQCGVEADESTAIQSLVFSPPNPCVVLSCGQPEPGLVLEVEPVSSESNTNDHERHLNRVAATHP